MSGPRRKDSILKHRAHLQQTRAAAADDVSEPAADAPVPPEGEQRKPRDGPKKSVYFSAQLIHGLDHVHPSDIRDGASRLSLSHSFASFPPEAML